MKLVCVWIILMFVSVSGFAQVVVHGVVTSGQKPVGYVTIGIKGTTRSVMSNENGDFTLAVSALPQTIIVSAIGFEAEEFVLTSDQTTIELKPRAYDINEVTVVGDAADLVFNKAYKRLMKPVYRAYNGKVFYRLVTQNDSNYTEMMEGFYDVQANPTGFDYWKLKHGRYAIVDDYKQQHYVKSVDFSALIKFVNIINDHRSGVHFPEFPFQPNAGKYYYFSRKGSVWLFNKEVSKIQFTPKKKGAKLFEGIAYIDESTGNLHRLEVNYSKPTSDLILTEVGHHPVSDLTVQYTIGFTEQAGAMLLSWVNTDLSYTYRSLAVRHSVRSQLQCFVYEKNKDLITSLNASDDQTTAATRSAFLDARSDYESIKLRLYIKPFWDENPVIRQTALQQKITRQFEQKGSFGMAYGETSDTLAIIKEGYAILGSKVNKLMSAIPETQPPQVDRTCIDVRLDGNVQATLSSKVFASYNCYRDSFYVVVLPLVDTTLTWMSDSIKNDEDFSFMFSLYARLTAVYSKKLTRELMQLKSPCLDEAAVEQTIKKTNDDLNSEQVLLLNDLWQKGMFPVWVRYIEKLEKEYW